MTTLRVYTVADSSVSVLGGRERFEVAPVDEQIIYAFLTGTGSGSMFQTERKVANQPKVRL